MLTMSATDARKEWSSVIDSVVRHKPAFIKRTRDQMVLCSTDTMSQVVEQVSYHATQVAEDDGSITLSEDTLGLVVNAPTLSDARHSLATEIMEYAEDYYQDFELYSHAPNRKGHLPYVMKAWTAKSTKEVEDAIICQVGEI